MSHQHMFFGPSLEMSLGNHRVAETQIGGFFTCKCVSVQTFSLVRVKRGMTARFPSWQRAF